MGFFDELNRGIDQHLTPAVKKVFLINVLLGLALIVLGVLSNGAFSFYFVRYFGLFPPLLIRGAVWQFLTYMFVHVTPMHLLFNMFVLWFFAPELEARWGSRRFWRFYLTTGVGAGVMHFVVTMLMLFVFHNPYELGPVIGASGALYGVMLAFAAYNPEAVVLFWGVFPIKVKYLVAIMIFLTFLSTAEGTQSGVSSLTHLSGLVIAYIYLSLHHRDWDIRHWQWR